MRMRTQPGGVSPLMHEPQVKLHNGAPGEWWLECLHLGCEIYRSPQPVDWIEWIGAVQSHACVPVGYYSQRDRDWITYERAVRDE
jgi:hypothetical protein